MYAIRSYYVDGKATVRLPAIGRPEEIGTEGFLRNRLRHAGDPLRFRDEVDLDPAPAWALSPVLSRGMPRAGGFRALVEGTGGASRESEAGPLVIFDRFRPLV